MVSPESRRSGDCRRYNPRRNIYNRSSPWHAYDALVPYTSIRQGIDAMQTSSATHSSVVGMTTSRTCSAPRRAGRASGASALTSRGTIERIASHIGGTALRIDGYTSERAPTLPGSLRCPLFSPTSRVVTTLPSRVSLPFRFTTFSFRTFLSAGRGSAIRLSLSARRLLRLPPRGDVPGQGDRHGNEVRHRRGSFQ